VGHHGQLHTRITQHLQGLAHMRVEVAARAAAQLDVWRPADGLETAVAWASAIERKDGPTALCLSRQNLPRLTDASMVEKIRMGGYVLAEGGNPKAIIVATGSETSLAMEAHHALAAEGISTRVVSMPCTNLFDRQPRSYQDSVLPLHLPTVAVEAAHPDFWRKYVGRTGAVVGIASFGESAPAKALYEHFGITTARVCDEVKGLLA
ncbi:transketolase C-terminal domain-containing protein, partial [Hydrogenophaga sp.]|uniref:transketolase-like TK C-terminal-containing protein n=1 Tax=Hydrogenophaga sp. TaxID=1904254 RepID=UPI00273005E3